MPIFPAFKDISIEDREQLHAVLQAYQPETSELTFTNLFIWQSHYATQWAVYRDWLVLRCTDVQGLPYFLQPVGPPNRAQVCRMLLEWLREECGVADPRLERADRRLVAELDSATDFVITPHREHFDYVYKTADLISLAGRKLHAKKNHVNKFTATHAFTYAPLDQSLISACLAMQDTWCHCHRCAEDMNLMGEWEAIKKLLQYFDRLQVQGGAIIINGTVEAFTIGELLNRQTAVVHIEKANTAFPGLYSVINQQFCEHVWHAVPFINREQDLGDEGLRQAKLSYHPERLVEKYSVRLAVR